MLRDGVSRFFCLCAQKPKYTDAVDAAKAAALEAAEAAATPLLNQCFDMVVDFLATLGIGMPCAAIISIFDEGMVAMCLTAVMFEAMCFSWLMIDIFPFHPQTGVPLVRLPVSIGDLLITAP